MYCPQCKEFECEHGLCDCTGCPICGKRMVYWVIAVLVVGGLLAIGMVDLMRHFFP